MGLWERLFLLLFPQLQICIYTILDPLKCLNDLSLYINCDFVFICVPTPMFEDGSQDLSYVESAFEKATR